MFAMMETTQQESSILISLDGDLQMTSRCSGVRGIFHGSYALSVELRSLGLQSMPLFFSLLGCASDVI
jgi:hypothetical protein